MDRNAKEGEAEGLLLVAKAPGLTSFQCLSPLKRSLGTGRIGHTGTLDKFASGLLAVLVGPYTRLGPWFTALDKEYLALVRFGEESDTLDPEGEIVARAEPPSETALAAILPSFRGPQLQAPPAYSAVHVDGMRASDRARRGEAPDMKKRPVVIHGLELLGYDGRDARLRVLCSSGTYIRSLARDIALALGSRARLEGLERLRVGPFALAEALAPEACGSQGLRGLSTEAAAALGLRPRILADAALRAFANGAKLRPEDFAAAGPEDDPARPPAEGGEDWAVYSRSGSLLGILSATKGEFRYRCVLLRGETGR